MKEEVEKLARRLSSDPRITTGTLRRMLKDIDTEIRTALSEGVSVPHAIAELREIVARACLLRRELERTGGHTPASRG